MSRTWCGGISFRPAWWPFRQFQWGGGSESFVPLPCGLCAPLTLSKSLPQLGPKARQMHETVQQLNPPTASAGAFSNGSCTSSITPDITESGESNTQIAKLPLAQITSIGCKCKESSSSSSSKTDSNPSQPAANLCSDP